MRIIVLLQVMCITLVFMGCSETKQNQVKVTNNAPVQWQNEYIKKLLEVLNSDISTDNAVFCIKDMDNDEVPELILKVEMEITVYTVKNALIEIGRHDFGTATTRMLYSFNIDYPGIFYNYTSVGIEHYGYVEINGSSLIVEELWNEDFSGVADTLGIDRERIEELSDDKDLINESKIVTDANSDLLFIELNSENIEIIK